MKIEWFSEKAQQLTLMVDGTIFRTVHTSIFSKKVDFQTTKKTLEDDFFLLECRAVQRYALLQLSRRSFHSFDLIKRLRDRLVSEAVIEITMEKLKQWGCLNDELYLERVIEKLRARSYGPAYIQKKLAMQGLPVDCIKAVLNRQNEGDQETQIRHLLEKRYSMRNLHDRKERQKVAAALQRKGFHLQSIFVVLNSFT